jgi:hypothetical protein
MLQSPVTYYPGPLTPAFTEHICINKPSNTLNSKRMLKYVAAELPIRFG